MTKNIATNYDAGHRWKSHADFNLICLPYNCKLYLFKHVLTCWPLAEFFSDFFSPKPQEIGVQPTSVACCKLLVCPQIFCCPTPTEPPQSKMLRDNFERLLDVFSFGQEHLRYISKCLLLTN